MSHLGATLGLVARGRVDSVDSADSAGGYAALTVFDATSEVLTVEYKINLLAPAAGNHLEAVGTVVRSGRTLTMCTLEVFGVQGTQRTLVATGQQTLIRIAGS